MSESQVARVQRVLGPPPDRRQKPRHEGELWKEPFTEAERLTAQAIIEWYKERQP